MKDLAGRVVVITGGASGIGRGMAEAFGEAGARLILADVHEARLKETKAALSKITDVRTLRTDVRDPDQIDALADFAYESFGVVHVLCNNAGVACHGLVWEHSLEDWDWVFETNVRSTVHGLRTFIPRMLEQGQPAHVVNSSSMLGLSSAPLTGVYGSSKQAVLAITETLAIDLALIEADIGVSALCPGPVRTHVGEEPGRSPVASAPVRETISAIDTALKAVVENGMDPREVGDRVVEAVRAGRFWILPAPEFVVNAETRLADILAAVGR
jgi:NAD(P)-dependent dehydrogenase (short-subunit alcohol dehydrogenase family)